MKVEFGVPTDKAGLITELGVEKGFFRDEGIDLNVRIVYGGPPLAAAFNSGELQIGEIGSPPAVVALSEGGRFRVIGSGHRHKAQMYFAANSAFKNWDDLKGKKVGLLSLGSCPEYFLRAMLRSRGYDPDTHFQWIGLYDKYARIVDLVRDGTLDAGIMVEPNISVGEADGTLNMWCAVFDEPSVPKIQWMVLVAREDLIAKDPNLIQAVIRANNRAGQYAVENVDEWAELGARRFGIDRNVMKHAALRELPHLNLDGQLRFDGLQEIISLQKKLGAIKQPLTVNDMVATSIVGESTEVASQ